MEQTSSKQKVDIKILLTNLKHLLLHCFT